MQPSLYSEESIPLDKSWVIRNATLDLFNGYDTGVRFLCGRYAELGSDLRSMYDASMDWMAGNPVRVGESGTILRFLKYKSWRDGLDKKFVLSGTLRDRKVADDPSIVDYSMQELLGLDGGTSQWASAAVLTDGFRRIEEDVPEPPYKLRLTYKALKTWTKKRNEGGEWHAQYDPTIRRQAEAFVDLLTRGETNFFPRHAEDYCFARAFDIVDREYGETFWGHMRNHEVDRIAGMERALEQSEGGMVVDSPDHRIAQAIAMRQVYLGREPRIKDMSVVNKSWPQFPKFLERCMHPK